MRPARLACCLLALAGLAPFASAQPLQLFDADAGLPLIRLHDPVTGRWGAPQGDWRAYAAWIASGAQPTGDPMAFLDSGVLAGHPYIKPVLKAAIDLTGEGPEDQLGHGTTVALIAILSAGDPAGKEAPSYTPIISIKVVGRKTQQDGTGLLLEGLKRAQAEGARIVNVSAGVDIGCVNARDPNGSPYLLQCEDTALCRFIAEQAEIPQWLMVVAAVGNTPGRTACPGCCRHAVAVGAADSQGRPAPYSGAFPDVLAPGSVRIAPVEGAAPPGR